jgi:hypothetical protein
MVDGGRWQKGLAPQPQAISNFLSIFQSSSLRFVLFFLERTPQSSLYCYYNIIIPIIIIIIIIIKLNREIEFNKANAIRKPNAHAHARGRTKSIEGDS